MVPKNAYVHFLLEQCALWSLLKTPYYEPFGSFRFVLGPEIEETLPEHFFFTFH